MPNRLLKEGICTSDAINIFDKEISALISELKSIPSENRFGLMRQRIYTKIRSIRMRKAKLTGTHTKEQWDSLQKKHNYKCFYCNGHHPWGLDKDHIIPISKGGSDLISNIVPSCNKCNSKKGVKIGQNQNS